MSARPPMCPVEKLSPGDVIEVYVCIENDEWDYVQRAVMGVQPLDHGVAVTYRVPDGWEGGGEYTCKYEPGETERLAYVDAPLVWEGDGG